jgi:hypothetical protein
MILLVESLLKSLFLYIIVCVCVLPAMQVGQQQDLLILLSEKSASHREDCEKVQGVY